MNTMLVWVLMTCTHVNSGCVQSYSPQVADLASCERMLKYVSVHADKKTCVQVRVYTK